MEILSWLFFIIFIAALVVVAGLLLRGYLTTGSPTSGITNVFFGPKPERRLDIVEQANVDGRRRLVLLRRDDVEHLIMTGGPVDVVIETGISHKAQATAVAEAADNTTALYSRAPRSLGTAVGEK